MHSSENSPGITSDQEEAPRESRSSWCSAKNTILSVSTGILALISTLVPSEAEAKKHQKKPENKPKIEYQVFPSGAKLERVTGGRLQELEGDSNFCNSLNWLRAKDRREIRAKCEYYNPWNNGVPLLRIHPKDLKVKLAPHFTVGELARIDPKDRRFVRGGEMIEKDGEFYGKYVRIDREILTVLESIRAILDREIEIDEGYRGYGYNGMTYYEGQGCKNAKVGKRAAKRIRNEMKGRGKKAIAKALRDANTGAKQACIKEKSVHTSGGALDMAKVPGLYDAAKYVVEKRGSGGVGRYNSPIIHVDARDNTIAMWPRK